MKSLITLPAAAAMAIGTTTFAAALPSTSATTTYQRAQVDGVGIFYREAGPKDAPTIVLLHGFPSSSRMFDTLIPLLATRYHLIAPDYPGFGQSDAPSPAQYRYTFDHLAETTNALLEQLKIDRYFLYMQDYGGPVGFRIMVKHPERIRGIIVQNANAYKEGLGAKWTGIAQYWADPKAHPEIFKAFSSLEGAKQRHIAGSPHPERYNPDTGPMSMRSCRGRTSRRFKPTCFSIIKRTSRRTRSGRLGYVSTSLRPSSCGDATTFRSSRLARLLLSATCRTPRSTCSTPATLHSTK